MTLCARVGPAVRRISLLLALRFWGVGGERGGGLGMDVETRACRKGVGEVQQLVWVGDGPKIAGG
eukprot:SAG31_NODE_657_length_13108_cov_3.079330_5_plen_65_part_00